MQTLFSIELEYPPGFTYVREFTSEEEERYLVAEISKLALHNFTFQGYTANRKVASYGYDYSFDKKRLKKGEDIPGIFKPIIERIGKQTNIAAEQFEELLITAYPIGAVINWHRDAPPFDVIAGISLQANCNFRLRPYDATRQKRNLTISLPVQRRSLYVLQGEARSDWQHSIGPVKEVRYSITLRTLMNSERT